MDEARLEQTAGWITYRAWSAEDIIIGGLTVGTLYRDTEEAGDASLHWREPIRESAAWRAVVQRERGEAFGPDDLEGGWFATRADAEAFVRAHAAVLYAAARAAHDALRERLGVTYAAQHTRAEASRSRGRDAAN